MEVEKRAQLQEVGILTSVQSKFPSSKITKAKKGNKDCLKYAMHSGLKLNEIDAFIPQTKTSPVRMNAVERMSEASNAEPDN